MAKEIPTNRGYFDLFNRDKIRFQEEDLKNRQVLEVCEMMKLTLAREVIWAEEAVEKFKDDYYIKRLIEFHPRDYRSGELKRKLWESKVKLYIITEKAKFVGLEVDVAPLQEAVDRLTAEIVAHRLTHKAPATPLVDFEWDISGQMNDSTIATMFALMGMPKDNKDEQRPQ